MASVCFPDFVGGIKHHTFKNVDVDPGPVCQPLLPNQKVEHDVWVLLVGYFAGFFRQVGALVREELVDQFVLLLAFVPQLKDHELFEAAGDLVPCLPDGCGSRRFGRAVSREDCAGKLWGLASVASGFAVCALPFGLC